MGETNCNVASNFDCNHSHDFCALVVAHSLMTASIRQQPIEPFGYLALGEVARPGLAIPWRVRATG